MFGRDPPSLVPSTPSSTDPTELAADAIQTLEEANMQVRKLLLVKNDKSAKEIELHKGQPFKVGDKVLLMNPVVKQGLSPKLISKFRQEFKIIGTLSDQTVKMIPIDGGPCRIVNVGIKLIKQSGPPVTAAMPIPKTPDRAPSACGDLVPDQVVPNLRRSARDQAAKRLTRR